MEKEKKEGNYFTGIIGAIMGGIIATVPWILAYVFGNVILSLLAVLIAAGELFGYKTFKGKMNKKVPAIIMIIAILIVTIVTLLVIPAIQIAKEDLSVNINSIRNIYSYKEFSTAIFRDYAISVIFTIIGAGVITKKIKKDLLLQTTENKKTQEEADKKIKQDAIDLIKPIFEKYGAIEPSNTLTKEEVFAEIENENKKSYFSVLKGLDVVKKTKGRYYYIEENEQNTKSKKKVGVISIITICVVFAILVICSVYAVINKSQETKKIWNDDVSYEIATGWQTLKDYTTKEGWSYYQYIAGLPSSTTNTEENTIDYTSYPATLTVSYDLITDENAVDSVETLKDTLNTYISENLMPQEYKIDIITTKKGYQAVQARLYYITEPEEIDYIYYIYNEGKLAYITSSTYNSSDDEKLNEQTMNIVDSFDWTK